VDTGGKRPGREADWPLKCLVEVQNTFGGILSDPSYLYVCLRHRQRRILCVFVKHWVRFESRGEERRGEEIVWIRE
jgi:hypothetical protein